MRSLFRGGVHPRDSKGTKGAPIRDLPLPPLMVLSLSQHIGAPSRALVSPGDRVLGGQPVAEATGFVSVPLHAPTSGVVRAVEPRPHPSGRPVPAVVLEPDGKEEVADPSPLADPGLAGDPDRWRKAVREAGLVGLGGAAFPTHVKLSPPAEKPIDIVIANGAECEPFLTADHRLMLEEADRIARGLAVALAVTGARRAFVALEANKPDAAEALSRASLPAGTEVVLLPVRYPQGAEKQLIAAVLGREVPSGGLPMDVGALVQNVGTLAALADAVLEGRPLTRRIMTLGGSLPAGPGNYRVALGTLLSQVVEATGGLKGPAARIIMGGPMMGLPLSSLEFPVLKGTSGLLAFGPGELPRPRNLPCVRCGACVRACPMGLMPHTLGNLVQAERFGDLEGARLMDCIECGCCAFTCPAERELVQAVKQGKAHLAARRGKK